MVGSNRHLHAALTAWITVIIILSGGCQAPNKENAAAAPSASHTAAAESPSVNLEALQSNSEMELVRLSQFLMSMDSVPSAAISHQQAEEMLPYVKKSVNKGTLSDEDKRSIVTLFRPEQLRLYNEWSRQKPHPQQEQDSRTRQETAEWPHGDKSLEQQLVDFLESKASE